jgi:cobalt-zinc-cadmium resistance protein CzcA
MNAEEVLTIVRNGLGGKPVSVLLDGVKPLRHLGAARPDALRDSICRRMRATFRCAPQTGALVPLSAWRR